ncbi:hypothetical protein CYMTET_15344 [Cymbomonas tetramitiformis]|uniref:Uncharacterized protein n=1 Tax=Cymbomonas tetramitiformis TaxID=36881 RepID=A0AAE0GFN2_9CHLO|nr:hypothetical protein CYMTET_15344 [Cymbomonas tetramitiformis]
MAVASVLHAATVVPAATAANQYQVVLPLRAAMPHPPASVRSPLFTGMAIGGPWEEDEFVNSMCVAAMSIADGESEDSGDNCIEPDEPPPPTSLRRRAPTGARVGVTVSNGLVLHSGPQFYQSYQLHLWLVVPRLLHRSLTAVDTEFNSIDFNLWTTGYYDYYLVVDRGVLADRHHLHSG